jgi:hypothetical protein
MADKKLRHDRSWLKEEDYINLGNIGARNNRYDDNNKEQEKHWAYRLIKQEGAVKTLKINSNKLKDFLNITNQLLEHFRFN